LFFPKYILALIGLKRYWVYDTSWILVAILKVRAWIPFNEGSMTLLYHYKTSSFDVQLQILDMQPITVAKRQK
jgi:hypothetical protein